MSNPLLSPKLRTRLISALLLAPIVLWVLWMGGLWFLALAALTYALCLYEWWTMSRRTARVVPWAALGLVYITISFASFCALRLDPDFGLIWTITLFLGVWSSDSFAYIAGKSIGGPKLLPAVSPKKTIAGLFGAMLGCGAMFLLISSLYAGQILGLYETLMILAFGAVIGVTGQVGDLLISRMKRVAGLKDTGALIPGHGGLLDRVDSLLLACPMFTMIMMIFT